MKNSNKIFLAIICIAALIYSSVGCKKESASAASASISFEKQDYYPLEIALLTSQTQISDGQYTGDIDGSVVKPIVKEGYMGVLIPILAAGKHTLNVTVNGQVLSAAFNVKASPSIPDPDAVFNSAKQTISTNIQSLSSMVIDTANPTATAQILSDYQTIQHKVDSLSQVYNSLSAAEKMNCALFMSANQSWLVDFHTSTTNYVNASLSFKTQQSIYDTENGFDAAKALADQQKAAAKLIIGKIIWSAIAGGAIAATFSLGIGTGAGAAIGGIIGLYKFLPDLIAVSKATDRAVDATLQPVTDQMTANKTNTINLNFNKNISRIVNVTMPYRSFYAADINSSVTPVKDMAGDLVYLKSFFDQVISYFPCVLQYKPKDLTQTQNYRISTKAVNSSHITVSNISNNSVSLVSTDKTDGYLNLKFNTTATTDQSFSFDLLYDSELGSSTLNINGNLNLDSLYIGQSYQGGIIAYIYQPGDYGYVAGQTHGIIAAPSDQSTGAQWGCSGTFLGAGDTAKIIGYGLANTNYIVANCATAGTAAQLCKSLNLGGYSDWYLPSIEELRKLYQNLAINSMGNFNSMPNFSGVAVYWSSSEYTMSFVWCLNFSAGFAGNTPNKSTALYVRAVRAF